MDSSLVVHADDEQNARVKANLLGLTVTRVEAAGLGEPSTSEPTGTLKPDSMREPPVPHHGGWNRPKKRKLISSADRTGPNGSKGVASSGEVNAIVDRTRQVVRQPQAASSVPRSQANGLGFIGWALLVLAGAFVIGLVKSNGKVDNNTVIVLAEGFAKERLKDTGSAEFSDVTVSENADGSFLVTGFVTARNSFNARKKTGFTCSLRVDNERGKLINITFLE